MIVFGALAEQLDRLEAAFVVGGSLASSVRGIPRSTIDIDLIVRITVQQVAELAEAMGSDWHIDVEQAREALRYGRSFNFLHLRSGLKFDFFPACTAFHQAEIARATTETLIVEGETIECPVVTAEDILIAKLRWYADGGQVSDRQWSDIVGIVRANPSLDRDYVGHWAQQLDVQSLFERALGDAQQ